VRAFHENIMRIAGLDIGQGTACIAVLENFPVNIQKHFKIHRKDFIKLNADKEGLEKFINFQVDGIVLEPTGGWYSSYWVEVAKNFNIPVYLVGHADLAAQRKSYGFTNKRDEEDALCLAATFFDDRFIDQHGKKRWLNRSQFETLNKIRSAFFDREQLDKIRSGLIAQLKLRLSYEYPEIAGKQWIISQTKGYTPYAGWLAGILKSKSRDNKYEGSSAYLLGIRISDYTRLHSKMLVDIEQRLIASENQLMMLLDCPEFEPYLQIFNHFKFGLINKSLLLLHIYPFDKFLLNGKRWMEYDRINGKRKKYDRSLKQFQAYLGLSFSLEQSGDSLSKKFHGSSVVRSHLYAWAITMVLPGTKQEDKETGYKIGGEIGLSLGKKYEAMRTEEARLKGKDAIIRLLFKVTRTLFNQLYFKLK
jgi:hypothetical protein